MRVLNKLIGRRLLEPIIADGLRSFGEARHELASWVVTGLPKSMPRVPSSGDERAAGTSSGQEHQAMMKAVMISEPIVEWRLGQLTTIASSGQNGPADPLYQLWRLRRYHWPDDERVGELIAAAGIDERDLLQLTLGVELAPRDLIGFVMRGDRPAGLSPLSELRRQPRFSRLVTEYRDLVVAELATSAQRAAQVAEALSEASEAARRLFAAEAADLACERGKQRREAGDKLARSIDDATITAQFQRLIVEATPGKRAAAIRAWARLAGDERRIDVIDFCAAQCTGDKAAGVQQAIAELHQGPAPVIVHDDPNVTRHIAGIGSSKYRERADAARELARSNVVQAVDLLHQAAAKETNEHAFSAQIGALHDLGESIDRYVEPESLRARAAKAMKKRVPVDGEWIDLAALPDLRWADGTTVDRVIGDWLVVRSVRLIQTSTSELARRVFATMEPASVHRFAAAVLVMWIAYDLRSDPADGSADDNGATGRQPTGSAIKAKGMLSLVGAGGDLSIVEPASAYVRKWYRLRGSQASALLNVLADIGEPEAIQFILSVAARYRTNSIRFHARMTAGHLASSKGLTIDELAYQSVPTAGFDARGSRRVDVGGRTVVAELDDGLEITVCDDDPNLVAEAMATLESAQQNVAETARDLPYWLHESLCLQREINVDDFKRFVIDHPVLSRLATRLVWVAVSGQGRVLFRPIINGTPIDVDGNEIDIDDADHVVLAHEVTNGVDAGRRWQSHFADRGLVPLFAQFDRPPLPAVVPGQVELAGYEDVIIDRTKLRRIAPGLTLWVSPVSKYSTEFEISRVFVEIQLTAVLIAMALAESPDGGVQYELVGPAFTKRGTLDPQPLTTVPPVLLVEMIAEFDQILAAKV